jgi:hypothetical protein
MRSRWAAAAADACCVLLFVVIGRASHAKGETLGGIASTAWPFLAALALGWVASRGWRKPLALLPTGVTAWLVTVALGMAARAVSGQGTAAAFIIVALAFLGLFLLGWRMLWKLARITQSSELPRAPNHRKTEFAGSPASKPSPTRTISASS